jgi:hypothetical protein
MPLNHPININDLDLTELFDPAIEAVPFADPRINEIPSPGSIIYTVWHDELGFIYVGIGGVGQSSTTPLEKRNPRSRIKEHSLGRRSGDQFCVYVHDFFVIPELIKSGSFIPEKGLLDKLTKAYIHKHLSYRFMVFQTDDSARLVRDLEIEIQRGVPGFGKPMLNPKD